MAEVRVKIGADIQSLQKGVRDSQKELVKLSSTAKQATSSIDGTSKSIQQIKDDARAALAAGQDMGEGIASGMSTAKVQALGLSKVLSSGLFLGVLAAAADYLGGKLVEAFTEGKRAADEARESFSKALPNAINFDLPSDPFQVTSREQALAVFGDAQAEIVRIQKLVAETQGNILQQAGRTAARVFGVLGVDKIAKQQQQLINVYQAQLGEQEAIAAAAAKAVTEFDNGQRISRNVADNNLETESSLKAQEATMKSLVREAEALLKLRAQAFAAVPGAPSPLSSRDVRQAPKPNNFGVDPSQFVIFPNAGTEDADTAQRVQGVLDAQAALNAQLAEGRDLFTELGVQGVAALADVALGFERLQDLGNILKDIVKQLVKDLILAAAKAALVSVFFPGASQAAGGFKALFGQNLGLKIPGLASGGVVTKPTLSLIGEAGPEAVVPLSKLGSMGGGQSVHIPNVTIRGGDLVIAFQQARKNSARTVGNIPLQ